jgi:hypothetical protein
MMLPRSKAIASQKEGAKVEAREENVKMTMEI